MRSFAIPAPIRGVTFRQYIVLLIDSDPRAASGFGLRAATRVEGEILRAEDTGTNCVLAPRDWQALRFLLLSPDPSCLTRSDEDSAEKKAAYELRLSSLDGPFVQAVVNAAIV